MEFGEFEWDDDKNVRNIRDHGIDFQIAVEAFEDDRSIPYSDPKHSTVDEPRYALIGLCSVGLVFISFTYRGDRCRIISARKASRQMQRIYAETD
ncbi:MAG: BrnT family toxin [Pyrinomonadaceae bacterium]